MSLNAHITELTALAELAMTQSLRCERAAEAVGDLLLTGRLSDLSRARTLLRLELEAKLRAMGGVPMVRFAGSGGLDGLHAAKHLDVVPDAQSILQQVVEAENELCTALIGCSALDNVDPMTRLGTIIDGITEARQVPGSGPSDLQCSN
jgi:hypothetical protein